MDIQKSIEQAYKNGYEKGKKETAEKILRDFTDVFPKIKGISSSHAKINRYIEELTKQFDIEIKK